MACSMTNQPTIKPNMDIPAAFSKCANCGVSYSQSPNPVESVLLVCLHSFCKVCINEGCLRSDKGDPNLVTCCKCKCNSNRADCGINLLADSDIKQENLNIKPIKCSSCNDQTIATSKCTLCNDMLCDACVSAHKRVKLTRDHPILPLTESSNASQNGAVQNKLNKRYSCAKHSTERLQFYCDQCSKVTCTKCHDPTGEHFNHTHLDVGKASANFRQNLAVQLQNLTEKEQTVSQALDIVNEKTADVDEAEAKSLSEVREYYNTCMEALRVRMNCLGSEIKKLASSKRQILEKTKDDVGHLQSRLDETIRAVGYVASSADPIAILSVRKGMSHHMATLLKLKCQVPNPSHKLTIQLQTERTLTSQVIPSIGRILVDGVPVSPTQPSPATSQQTNGVRPSPSPPRQNTAPPPPRQNLAPPPPRQNLAPPPLRQNPGSQHRVPLPVVSVQAGGTPAIGGSLVRRPLSQHPNSHPARHAVPRPRLDVNNKRPTLSIPQRSLHSHMPPPSLNHSQLISPPPLRQTIPQPQLVPLHHAATHSNGVSAASSGQYPLYQQRMTHVSQPVTINQAAIPVAVAAHSVFPGQQPSPGQKSADSRPASSAEQPAIKLKLRLDPNKDPVAINGDHPRSRHNSQTKAPKEDTSLKISSVVSLAEDRSTTNGDSSSSVPGSSVPGSSVPGSSVSLPLTNGLHTPPRDRPVAKKRRKAPLSPYHIATHHSPDDPNEDYCAVCHNGGELICCDTCPKVYHANCHVPELTGTPSSFSCSLCWDEKEIPASPEVPAGSKRKAPSGLSDYEVRICEKILLKLFCHKRSLAFHLPVPKTVKHYSTTIKNPTDFISIRKKLMRQHFNHYNSVKEFVKEMRLVFSNCVAFNGPLSDYTESARVVQQYFVEHIEMYFPELDEIASSILPPEDVMNTSFIKKHVVVENDSVVHIS